MSSSNPKPSLATPSVLTDVVTGSASLAAVPTETAVQESRFHTYVGYAIPWYVRAIWIIFWLATAHYVIRFLLPALSSELLSPP
jgi:hypothetical protein